MSRRIQTVNGDTILEITETATAKTRYSENTLLRRKAYLEQSLTRFGAELQDVTALLNEIATEKANAQ